MNTPGRYPKSFLGIELAKVPLGALAILACLLLLALLAVFSILLLASGAGFLQDSLTYFGYAVLGACIVLTCLVIGHRLSSMQYAKALSGSLVLFILLLILTNWSDLALVGSFYLAGMLSTIF